MFKYLWLLVLVVPYCLWTIHSVKAIKREYFAQLQFEEEYQEEIDDDDKGIDWVDILDCAGDASTIWVVTTGVLILLIGVASLLTWSKG